MLSLIPFRLRLSNWVDDVRQLLEPGSGLLDRVAELIFVGLRQIDDDHKKSQEAPGDAQQRPLDLRKAALDAGGVTSAVPGSTESPLTCSEVNVRHQVRFMH